MNEIKYVQLEPAAFLSDIDFQMMSAEERGIYCSIIFYLYCNGGKIELLNNNDITLLQDKTARLAVISNCLKNGKEWQAVWSKIAHKFVISNNILFHKRVTIELERAKNFFDDKSRAGKIGMKNRWGDNTVIPPVITKVSKVKLSKVNVIYNKATGNFENITPEDLKNWKEAYPAVDIELSIKQAAEWLKSNPDRHKKNNRRFLINWFSRTQEKGGNKNARSSKGGLSGNRQRDDY